MQYIQPDYYTAFRCTASDCADNCCIGWEIDIDDSTAAAYRAQGGPFGERLRHNICFDADPPHFKLNGERCPFLNGQNLCDIILQLGEDQLCDICTQHPRFHNWFGSVTESGLGLCCEAAGRLIFVSDAPAAFISSETDETDDPDVTVDPVLFGALTHARKQLFALLQDRTLSIRQRVATMLAYGADIQDRIDSGRLDEIINLHPNLLDAPKAICKADLLSDLLGLYESLEPIDPLWTNTLATIRTQVSDLIESADAFDAIYMRQYEYEHLLVYLIYRYFLQAVFDEDVLSKIKLAAMSLIVIALTDLYTYAQSGAFTLEDRIRNAKAYSKEIEYSAENLNTLYDESYMNDFLQTDALIALFWDK